jgi:polyisoprenoid-binding protein YceI
MKKITLLGLALIAGLSFQSCSNSSEESETTEETSASVQNGTFSADLTASTVGWKGVMLGVKEHTGFVSLSGAEFTLTDGAVTGGKFTVDLNSIALTDSAYDENSTREKLLGHLTSPDFFSVEAFPTATFEITGAEGNTVTGNLTIRGITNQETVKGVEVHTVGDVTAITGNLTFDRKKYEVSFDVPMKDMVISNDIELSINLVAAQ